MPCDLNNTASTSNDPLWSLRSQPGCLQTGGESHGSHVSRFRLLWRHKGALRPTHDGQARCSVCAFACEVQACRRFGSKISTVDPPNSGNPVGPWNREESPNPIRFGNYTAQRIIEHLALKRVYVPQQCRMNLSLLRGVCSNSTESQGNGLARMFGPGSESLHLPLLQFLRVSTCVP